MKLDTELNTNFVLEEQVIYTTETFKCQDLHNTNSVVSFCGCIFILQIQLTANHTEMRYRTALQKQFSSDNVERH